MSKERHKAWSIIIKTFSSHPVLLHDVSDLSKRKKCEQLQESLHVVILGPEEVLVELEGASLLRIEPDSVGPFVRLPNLAAVLSSQKRNGETWGEKCFFFFNCKEAVDLCEKYFIANSFSIIHHFTRTPNTEYFSFEPRKWKFSSFFVTALLILDFEWKKFQSFQGKKTNLTSSLAIPLSNGNRK